jgi:hypothetical protein
MIEFDTVRDPVVIAFALTVYNVAELDAEIVLA